MQYIAEDPLHVVVRNEQPQLVDTQGRVVREKGRRLFAKFARGTAPAFARAKGIALFEFRRMPQGVGPEQWVSFYDSAEAQAQLGWTDEERKAIEEKLAITDGVVAVETPRAPRPWPDYDTIVAGKDGPGLSNAEVVARIVTTIEVTGFDPRVVLSYEQENRKRKSVIEAIEKLVEEQPADSLVDQEELVEA